VPKAARVPAETCPWISSIASLSAVPRVARVARAARVSDMAQVRLANPMEVIMMEAMVADRMAMAMDTITAMATATMEGTVAARMEDMEVADLTAPSRISLLEDMEVDTEADTEVPLAASLARLVDLAPVASLARPVDLAPAVNLASLTDMEVPVPSLASRTEATVEGIMAARTDLRMDTGTLLMADMEVDTEVPVVPAASLARLVDLAPAASLASPPAQNLESQRIDQTPEDTTMAADTIMMATGEHKKRMETCALPTRDNFPMKVFMHAPIVQQGSL